MTVPDKVSLCRRPWLLVGPKRTFPSGYEQHVKGFKSREALIWAWVEGRGNA